jgi:predicted nuclease of predicted toxin-antitoxin system
LKLLFDANLSPKLGGRLAELFPHSVHVFDTGLARHTSDETIWEYARATGFTIGTADCDFLNLAGSRGAPPKVVHREHCNYRTAQVEEFMQRHAIWIAELEESWRSTLVIRSGSTTSQRSTLRCSVDPRGYRFTKVAARSA